MPSNGMASVNTKGLVRAAGGVEPFWAYPTHAKSIAIHSATRALLMSTSLQSYAYAKPTLRLVYRRGHDQAGRHRCSTQEPDGRRDRVGRNEVARGLRWSRDAGRVFACGEN